MSKKDDDFQKRLLAGFKIEAEEHLNTMSTSLLDLEKMPSLEKQADLIERLFREVHSLKGAARAVGRTDLEPACQAVEDLFASLKRKEISVSKPLFDLLHDVVNGLTALLRDERAPGVDDLIKQVRSARKGISGRDAVVAHRGSEPEAARPLAMELQVSDTLRIRRSKLDSIFLQTEELIPSKLAFNQHAMELRDLHSSALQWEKEWTKEIGRADRKKSGNGTNAAAIAELLEWNSSRLRAMEARLAELSRLMDRDHRLLARSVDSLLEDAKKALMLPFSSLLEILPGFVRELAREQAKEVELVIRGGEVEIDRRILEQMKDPVLHLVRNCVDHGIEKPEVRRRSRKPDSGSISIQLSQKNGSTVELAVADDGTGIPLDKVRASAVKLGTLSAEDAQRFSDEVVLAQVFQSGVSTSPVITDISGRGLGLAIVREKVEKLGGSISVESHSSTGTTFRILLPLTLAMFRGILVRVREQIFALPATNVVRVGRVNKEMIRTVENREMIQMDGRMIPLLLLGDLLELGGAAGPAAKSIPVLILGSAQRQIALRVDEVLGDQEIVVKTLGTQLARVRNVAGVTILATGKVVPILNVSDLVKSALAAHAAAPGPAGEEEAQEAQRRRKNVLVVEDSITARTLLKNILESAGYSVTTAVDGIDAITVLKEADFDLVVSDVDMPRMNGLDLTAKIRSDAKLSVLPVILVTAMESREDRERGIDVGANAYIVKSSFDQSNLLEVIHRLT